MSAKAAALFRTGEPGYPPNSPDFNPCELIISQIKNNAHNLYLKSDVKGVKSFIDCVKLATKQVSTVFIHRTYKHIWQCMNEAVATGGDFGDAVHQKGKIHKKVFNYN
jgi:hypothetical protein